MGWPRILVTPVSNLATKLDMKNTCPYSLNGYRRLSGEFESLLLRQVGASFVSLAPTYFISRSALTPPLLLFKPRTLVPVCGLRRREQKREYPNESRLTARRKCDIPCDEFFVF